MVATTSALRVDIRASDGEFCADLSALLALLLRRVAFGSARTVERVDRGDDIVVDDLLSSSGGGAGFGSPLTFESLARGRRDRVVVATAGGRLLSNC